MPFKTGLTFTYDCGEFEKNMDLALELADLMALRSEKRKRASAGRLRGLGFSNTIERAAAAGLEGAEVRFRPLRHGDAVVRLGRTRPRP